MRVSRIFAPWVPAASTNWRVKVAIPLRCWRKLSATRSAVRIERARPRTSRTAIPPATVAPSFCTISMRRPGIDPAKDLRRDFRPGDDRAFLGDGAGGSLVVFAHEILARDIAAADVFTQGEIDQMEIFLGEIHALAPAKLGREIAR